MWRSSQHNPVTCGVVWVPVRPGGVLCSSERGLNVGREMGTDPGKAAGGP